MWFPLSVRLSLIFVQLASVHIDLFALEVLLHLADSLPSAASLGIAFQRPAIPQAQTWLHISLLSISYSLYPPVVYGKEGLHLIIIFYFLPLAQQLVFKRNAVKVCGLEDIIVLIKTTLSELSF